MIMNCLTYMFLSCDDVAWSGWIMSSTSKIQIAGLTLICQVSLYRTSHVQACDRLNRQRSLQCVCKPEPAMQGGEKEYYLATAAEEIYVAPTAQFSLRGFKVAGAQRSVLLLGQSLWHHGSLPGLGLLQINRPLALRIWGDSRHAGSLPCRLHLGADDNCDRSSVPCMGCEVHLQTPWRMEALTADLALVPTDRPDPRSSCVAPAGTFLRGVLDKVGVQPELVRIGKFKSAGDQLLRSDMSVRCTLSSLAAAPAGFDGVCTPMTQWQAKCLVPASTARSSTCANSTNFQSVSHASSSRKHCPDDLNLGSSHTPSRPCSVDPAEGFGLNLMVLGYPML